MNVFDGLETEKYDRQYSDIYLIKEILKYVSVYKKYLSLIILCTLSITVLEISVPVTISWTIDTLIINGRKSLIPVFALLILVFGLGKWISNYIKTKYLYMVIASMTYKLRDKVYDSLLNQDLDFFYKERTARIVTRLLVDTEGFAKMIELVVSFFSQLCILVILSTWLFLINVSLTFYLLLMMLVSFIVSLSFRSIARNLSRSSKKAESMVNASLEESISGIKVAKVFKQEKVMYERFSKNNERNYKIGLWHGLYYSIIFPLMAIFAGLGLVLVVYLGGNLVEKGSITAGQLVLFIQTEAYFWYPMMQIASFWSILQENLASSERILSLINLKPQVVQNDNKKIDGTISEIEFNEVLFSYNPQTIVLKNISLKISKSQKVAIVGHTGSGKSSILKLILRHYNFQDGSIKINGVNIQELDLNDYLSRIGVISQTPHLFSGTVRDNIKYTNKEATDTELMSTVKLISNGDWLNDLVDGLDTEIGENGSLLSAGQKQIVALMRIMLKNPDIIILDEATANIDSYTEAQIQEGLDKLMVDKTIVMVAHRLSTLNKADHIIVMEKGVVIEEGSKRELLEKNGVYKQFYNKFYNI